MLGCSWKTICSLPSYIKGNGPDWLVMDRVLRSFELAQDGRGCDPSKKTFKDRLLKLLGKTSQTSGSTRNRTGEALREHGEAEAERIVAAW